MIMPRHTMAQATNTETEKPRSPAGTAKPGVMPCVYHSSPLYLRCHFARSAGVAMYPQ